MKLNYCINVIITGYVGKSTILFMIKSIMDHRKFFTCLISEDQFNLFNHSQKKRKGLFTSNNKNKITFKNLIFPNVYIFDYKNKYNIMLSNLNKLHYSSITECLNTRGLEIFFIELKPPFSYKKVLEKIETTVFILTNFSTGFKNDSLYKNVTFFKHLSIFSKLLIRPYPIYNID